MPNALRPDYRNAMMEHRAPPSRPYASDRAAALSGAANFLAFVPGVGDAAGLAADAAMYADEPQSRNWKNYLMTALGALPFVPGAAHAIFAGPLAKTADLTALEKAKGMVKLGVPDEEVWRSTGWWVNTPDGVPRFEIDDSASVPWGALPVEDYKPNVHLTPDGPIGPMAKAFNERIIQSRGSGLKHSDILQHPELEAAYSGMQTRPARVFPREAIGGAKGTYEPDIEMLTIADDLYPSQVKSTASHELQHAVQGWEGMGRGGSVDSFARDLKREAAVIERKIGELNRKMHLAVDNPTEYEQLMSERMRLVRQLQEKRLDDSLAIEFSANQQYRRLAGEAESRAVQSRMNFTPTQRRATPPWQSYDVPLNELIIRR